MYDTLIKINEEASEIDFNEFLIRLLFLLFAEDTNIMPKSIFTNALKTRTSEDGSDMNAIISQIFTSLDVDNRNSQSEWLRKFPYVNGKLFSEAHVNLKFDKETRKLILEAGELLDWNEINPDILGSMIQTVANAEQRAVTGMHYTSVENILKLIKPLFLDELTDIYKNIAVKIEENEDKDITEKSKQENRRNYTHQLEDLLKRLSKIKFFDPACGSGNFLIISYKEIRRLEIKIIKAIRDLKDDNEGRLWNCSTISLNQFYGIELDDFAHEVARLSLWIAEHQMNVEMTNVLVDSHPNLLPLKDAGNIICGNALRINWQDAVPHGVNDELYIMGNPPYIGAKLQSKEQKLDMQMQFGHIKKFKKLDYICAWFLKGSDLIISDNVKLAFVTTNSISQGEQVAFLWKLILDKNVEIKFAHTSFKWSNNAKYNAGITVAIIGLEYKNTELKYLFDSTGVVQIVEHINPYLVNGLDIMVSETRKSISNLPKMVFGNMPRDGGGLILSNEYEVKNLALSDEQRKEIIKKYIGSEEFINESSRFVIWIDDYKEYQQNSNVNVDKKIKSVYRNRLLSTAESTQKAAKTFWRFVQRGEYDKAIEKFNQKKQNSEFQSIIIPRVSSENRDYVPMGIVGDDTIISDSAMAIYDAPTWLLGLLESRMHMVWLRAIGGKLETRYRYSAGLVYNTFPVPELSTQRKNQLENQILDILDIREEIGGTLAELYNNATMPQRLREAHEVLDGIVERAYRETPFVTDEDRLSVLLNMYQEMTNNGKTK